MECAACQLGRAAGAALTQWHAVEHIVEFVPVVQILDVLVPPVALGGLQDRIFWRNVEQAFADDTEQEIAVPNISTPERPPPRAVLPGTQKVEQLAVVLPFLSAPSGRCSRKGVHIDIC